MGVPGPWKKQTKILSGKMFLHLDFKLIPNFFFFLKKMNSWQSEITRQTRKQDTMNRSQQGNRQEQQTCSSIPSHSSKSQSCFGDLHKTPWSTTPHLCPLCSLTSSHTSLLPVSLTYPVYPYLRDFPWLSSPSFLYSLLFQLLHILAQMSSC